MYQKKVCTKSIKTIKFSNICLTVTNILNSITHRKFQNVIWGILYSKIRQHLTFRYKHFQALWSKSDGFICRYDIDWSSHKCAYNKPCTPYNDLLGILSYTVSFVLGSTVKSFIDLTFSFDSMWPFNNKNMLHASKN